MASKKNFLTSQGLVGAGMNCRAQIGRRLETGHRSESYIYIVFYPIIKRGMVLGLHYLVYPHHVCACSKQGPVFLTQVGMGRQQQ